MKYAVDCELIEKAPKIGRYKVERPEIVPWDFAQYARLLAAAKVEGPDRYAADRRNDALRHRREIPPAVLAAGDSEQDPDRRILKMLAVRGSGVAASISREGQRSSITAS